MDAIRVVTGLAECQELWRRAVPPESMTDLWEVRACFQRQFQRPPCFVVAERGGDVAGLLPLSWIEESGCFGYFPGETWEGKTWLEQNRLVARDSGLLEAMLARVPGPYHLRYLLPLGDIPEEEQVADETGYLFHPPRYGYDIEQYFGEFSPKAARKVKRAIAAVEDLGVVYRYDELSDFGHMVRLNCERFGERSYFADARFRESFRDLMWLLHERGWLRMTTVLIGGEPAAVDMGCLCRGAYTLVAGGTHGDYLGVAKVINMHHMQRACRERMSQVDFLCGDFSWKTLFHLAPRPLYLLSNVAADAEHAGCAEAGEAARVG